MATSLHGFASITQRHMSLKPMIAAVNGPAYGGGVEILLNCDLVIASQDAVFALPEVKRGIMAGQGGQCVLTRTLHVANACMHACICCSNLPDICPCLLRVDLHCNVVAEAALDLFSDECALTVGFHLSSYSSASKDRRTSGMLTLF